MRFNFFKFAGVLTLLFTTVNYGQEARKERIRNMEIIDLSNWSVTVPEGNPNKPGKPVTVSYPEIMDYANNALLNPWMYNDDKGTSLVFYAKPTGNTTANSQFARTELRETMDPSDNNVNWTFAQGAYLKGVFKIEDISKEPDGKYTRVIFAQIHGRLSNQQKNAIAEDDNNAPPILKIYWDNGYIKVKVKSLKNPNASPKEILTTYSWGDDKGQIFTERVGFTKFTIEIKVSDGRLEVILDGRESLVYDSKSIKKWGVFQNYFKAGNYLQTNTTDSYAAVRIYSLVVTH